MTLFLTYFVYNTSTTAVFFPNDTFPSKPESAAARWLVSSSNHVFLDRAGSLKIFNFSALREIKPAYVDTTVTSDQNH